MLQYVKYINKITLQKQMQKIHVNNVFGQK